MCVQEALPKIIWRDVPVQHFATPKGEYDPAALGQQCQPLETAAAQQVHMGFGLSPGFLLTKGVRHEGVFTELAQQSDRAAPRM